MVLGIGGMRAGLSGHRRPSSMKGKDSKGLAKSLGMRTGKGKKSSKKNK